MNIFETASKKVGSLSSGRAEKIPPSLLHKWIRYLNEPVDGASLAAFRICFAATMLLFVWLFQDYVYSLYINTPIHFSFLPKMPVYPGMGLYFHYAAMALFAVGIGLGFFYRASSLLFFASWTYLFLLDKSYYQNHHYLICLLALLFFIVPANRVWSIDALSKNESGQVPRWSLLIFKFQFAAVYFFGGIAKFSTDWLQGYPQTDWMLARATDPVVGHIASQHWFIALITYGGIVIDLLLPVLLFWSRTFWLGAAVALLFHLANAWLFMIDIFPLLMISSIGLFAPPDWPRRVTRSIASLGRKVVHAEAGLIAANVSTKVQGELTTTHSLPEARSADVQAGDGAKSSRWQRRLTPALLVFVHVYVLVQILVPLRRFLYPGDVCWTEQASADSPG